MYRADIRKVNRLTCEQCLELYFPNFVFIFIFIRQYVSTMANSKKILRASHAQTTFHRLFIFFLQQSGWIYSRLSVTYVKHEIKKLVEGTIFFKRFRETAKIQCPRVRTDTSIDNEINIHAIDKSQEYSSVTHVLADDGHSLLALTKNKFESFHPAWWLTKAAPSDFPRLSITKKTK